MPEKLSLCLDFTNSHLPMKNTPFFSRKNGYEHGRTFWSSMVWSGGGVVDGRGIDNIQCPVKLFVGLHEVRGQPRFETRSLYHFMFKGEGGVVHGKMASAHFMCVTLLGNPYVNKQLICFRFKKNIRYSTTEYNLLSHLLFYTNVFYIFGLSHCEKPVYY